MWRSSFFSARSLRSWRVSDVWCVCERESELVCECGGWVGGGEYNGFKTLRQCAGRQSTARKAFWDLISSFN